MDMSLGILGELLALATLDNHLTLQEKLTNQAVIGGNLAFGIG